MSRFWREDFGNPSSIHSLGLKAKTVVIDARKKVASILQSRPEEVIFTNGGTEGNNIAILGIFKHFKSKGKIPHFISTNVEHPSALEVLKQIEKEGGEVTYIPTKENGIVKMSEVMGAVKENTVLISVMYANNEIGTIQPISEIGRALKEYKKEHGGRLPYFHTDACQAPNYLSINIEKLGVDLMTLDGSKIYGPKGSGVLYKRRNTEIDNVIFGGGQESGIRSGTENVPLIVGFAKALEITESVKEKEIERLTTLRDYFIREVMKIAPDAMLNGDKEKRLPNNANFCFPYKDSEFLLIKLDALGVAVSYSSACKTLAEDSSSYVVRAICPGDKCASSSLRFSLGRMTTINDIKKTLEILKKVLG